jgi:hypothetical protein
VARQLGQPLLQRQLAGDPRLVRNTKKGEDEEMTSESDEPSDEEPSSLTADSSHSPSRHAPSVRHVSEEGGSQEEGLIGGMRRALEEFPEHKRDIVQRRIGLCGPVQLLKRVAEDYGIGMDRIRQIQLRAFYQMKQRTDWGAMLVGKLQALRQGCADPLSVKGAEASDRWLAGISEHPDLVRYLLNEKRRVTPGMGLEIITIDGEAYFAQINQERWDRAVREARRLLASRVGETWSQANCRILIGNLLPDEGAEFRKLLWDHVSGLCTFAVQGKKTVLASFAWSVCPSIPLANGRSRRSQQERLAADSRRQDRSAQKGTRDNTRRVVGSDR